MKKIDVSGNLGNYQIIFDSINSAYKYIEDKKHIIITDETVNEIYGKNFNKSIIHKLKESEKNKNLNQVNDLYKIFLENGLDRHSVVVAFGGGIVLDMVGFAASTYMRGIPVIYIPTTLLSQTDASVGGKTGVNFNGYKNIVGSFNYPEKVIIDVSVLKTLSKQEFSNGLAEVIKHGVIADFEYFKFIENNIDKIMEFDKELLSEVVYRSIKIKNNIVLKDEKESGIRKILNFGHTFAHAIEKEGNITHGQAVSVGMIMACELSEKYGHLEIGVKERLSNLLEKAGLPTQSEIEAKTILKNLLHDKKSKGDSIDFVLLKEIGEAFIKNIKKSEIEI